MTQLQTCQDTTIYLTIQAEQKEQYLEEQPREP